MKIILIFVAFILLPASVGWSFYEIGKGVGKPYEVIKECPVLDCYCEECEQTALSTLLESKTFNINCE